MKLFLCLLLGACSVSPVAETRAVRDQQHLLYLRAVELPGVDDPRELVICKWMKDAEPSDCLAVFVSKTNKRIIFARDSKPYVDQRHGQREQWITVGAPAMVGSLVYLWSRRRALNRPPVDVKNLDEVVSKLPRLPRRVAIVGGLVTAGALFWTVIFEKRTWGAGKRALVRNFYAVFDRETDPSAAREVRDLAPLIKALAAEFDFVVSRPAKELLDG